MTQKDNKAPQDSDSTPEKPRSKTPSLHQDNTKPMPPQNPTEMDEFLPEVDEGPRAGPVDEIQAALFEAAQANLATDVDLDTLAKPAPETGKKADPEAVDEIQAALFEASLAGLATDVDFEKLAKPAPEISQEPADEVQAALQEASQANLSPSLDFEALPAPTLAPPKKAVRPRAPSRPLTRIERPTLSEPEFHEPEATTRTPPDFWLILALFVTFRGLTLLLLRPGGFIRDWSDFDTFLGIASLSDYGLYPFLDFWLEWPPLIPWLAVGAYRLALYLPPWPDDPRLWFVVIFGGVFVLFEAGNFFLIYRLARRLFDAPATVSRVLWIYAGLFPPLYLMLGFFDGVALFFMLLALELILMDRRFLSAIAVGLGIMIKIIPVLMLPVALRRLWHQYRANTREAQVEMGLYVVIVGLMTIVVLAPFLIWGPQWVLASARSMLDRSPWETVWALAEGYYGFGVVGGDRLNPDETNFAAYEGWLPWWLISLVFLGLYTYLFTRPADYDQPRNLVAFSGLTVIIFLLYSKGYSPQFLVYLLPFVLLLMPDGRGLTYLLILTFLNVLEQPIYFVLLPEAHWLLTFVVLARLIVLLALVVEFLFVLLSPLRLAPLAPVRQYAPLALGGLMVVALLILTPLTLSAYSGSQAANSSMGTFAGFMETQLQEGNRRPRLLLSDQESYQEIYPYLNQSYDLQLTDGTTRFEGAEALTAAELVRGLEQVWILPTGPQEAALQNAVSSRGTLLASYNFDDLGTASLYSFQRNPVPLLPLARFSGGMELLGHEVEVDARGVHVTLYWQTREPQSQELTVFTHLYDEAGEWVAGHDSPPRNGTAPASTWPSGTVQADPHLILIPTDLPPGSYTLMVGLRINEERLTSLAPDGSNYPEKAAPLEVIELP